MKLLLAFAAALSVATSCLLPDEIEAESIYQTTGTLPNLHPRSITGAQASRSLPVGRGDRFNNGSIAPIGLATDEARKSSILRVDEVESGLRALKAAYPDLVELFTPPFETHEGRSLPGAVIGGGENVGPRAFIMSGIHARERGGPDHVLYFVADLLASHAYGRGLSYGGVHYSPSDVQLAVWAGVVVLPVTNPDGVAHDQETGSCWRKNRRPGPGRAVGVDLNRNFDFLWDYRRAFSARASLGSAASDDPASQVYHGTSPASEPEVQAVTWVMDRHNASLSWFLDLHSYSGSVLYAWGDDDTGTEHPDQSFANATFDGMRGSTGTGAEADVYKEYMAVEDLAIEQGTASAIAESMTLALGVRYKAEPSVSLYPTCGCSNDYAMSRYYSGACGAGIMYGLCLEFGAPSQADPLCPFYPSEGEYHDSMRQVGAGLMRMLVTAAGPYGQARYRPCDNGTRIA